MTLQLFGAKKFIMFLFLLIQCQVDPVAQANDEQKDILHTEAAVLCTENICTPPGIVIL